MNYREWILILSNLPILAAAVYAAYIYKKLGRTLQVLTLYIFLTVLIQAPYLALWFCGKNNLYLLHLYVLLGFISLSVFYFHILKDFISPAIIISIAVLFSFFTIFNSLVLQGIHSINSNALSAQSVLVIVFSLSTFVVLLNQDVIDSRRAIVSSLRWINSGLFIYYTSALLLFYFSKMIVNEFSILVNQYAWMLNSFFITVMYICFIIGLWKRPKD